MTCLYENDEYVNSFAKLMAQVRGHATDSFTAHEWLMAEHDDGETTANATAGLLDTIGDLQEQVDKLTAECDKFRKLWETQCAETASRSADYVGEKRKVVELERELEAARAKNRSLKAHVGKMQDGRHVWHERAEALQSKLDALEAHGVTVSEPFCGGYEVYNQFACDWRERAEALEAERDELTAANDKWLAKLGELQAELADCEREREEYRARLGEAARLCIQAAALADGGR